MVFTTLQYRVVGQTAARLRKDAAWLYDTAPQLKLLQQFGRRCCASSQAGFTWGHKLPARVQAAAGIAAEVEHERVQHQSYSKQKLPQAALLSATPSSGNQKQHTGAFARLPMVPVSTEIIESALKRAGRVSANKKLKNEAQKARSRAAKQMDTLTKEVAVPLGVYMKGFPTVQCLHPFEQAMLELTSGTQAYEKVLSKVDSLRKSILQVGKGYAGRANKATTKAEAAAICQEGFESVEALYLKLGGCVDELKQVAQKLRRLPVVDPSLPVVALVGAPNVGKSSLVNVLSSGVPEVCDYPFTTRSIKMGHFYVNGQRHQVTDTPGLLERPLSERNAMERLTLACLSHLPSAVLFVLDLTAQCGTSVQDQLAIRQTLKQSFPDKLWLDVFSKSDLLTAHFQKADTLKQYAAGSATLSQQLENPSAPFVPDAQYESVSDINDASAVHEQQRASETGGTTANTQQAGTRNHANFALADLDIDNREQDDTEHACAQQSGNSDTATLLRDEQEDWGGVMDPANSMQQAVQAALMLPAALRISAVTQEGIETLQLATMQLLNNPSNSSVQKELT
ncbi:hypothetical protein ABBQ32_012817 [Trebouxia sp. C0010 RCD-2024]